MKSDLDHQQSSVNDMLEQIKKIMSHEQDNKEDNDIREENVLELSEELVVGSEKHEEKNFNEQYKNNSSLINNGSDLFNEIDRLIINSDLNQGKNIENNNQNTLQSSSMLEKNINLSGIEEDAKMAIFPEKQIFKNAEDEKRMENSENNNQNAIFRADDDKKTNLVSDNVVRESSKVIKELIGAIEKPADSLKFRSGVTVEELIVEVMKPQISEWLNAHLGVIVKKVVEKEVRKLIPREED